MELYNISDIRESIEEIISNSNFSISELKRVVLGFFNILDENLRNEVFKEISEELCIKPKTVFSYLEKVFDEKNNNREEIVHVAQIIAECSDNEDYCNHKIYVIIRDTVSELPYEIVREYSSWDEADKDVDDWYTGCCDDLYLAENMLFPILCSVREREYDYTVNFCTVVEFNANYFEDGREAWEEENCEYDEDEE